VYGLLPTEIEALRTGREDRIIRYCTLCGWRDEERDFPSGATTRHENCQRRWVHWVSFEKGIEDAEAESIVSAALRRHLKERQVDQRKTDS
jgi:hypothetical protein